MPTRQCLLSAACAAAVTLAGCGSAPAPTPVDTEVALKSLAGRGYRADRQFAIIALRETWRAGETSLDVSLVAPAQPGSFPLIVYLPGLGESAAAGILWRQAWAEAGYAVLTIQDTASAEAVWASAQARAGDFRALARQHFSANSLRARLAQVEAALAELGRRAAAGGTPYAAADARRMAVAGFDLGAQTAAALAGEQTSRVGRQGMGANVRAAILLSPYVEPSGRDAAQRFAAMKAPILSVTGTEDADPFGLVTTPARRLAPWQAMPPGGKYLLVLSGGTHSVLAGGGLAEAGGPAAPPGEAGNRGAAAPRTGGHGQHLNGSPRSGALPDLRAGGHGGRSHGGASAPATEHPAGHDGRRENLGPRPFEPRHIVAVRGVTTAFLDATLKDDAAARHWLAHDAASGLGASASLEAR